MPYIFHYRCFYLWEIIVQPQPHIPAHHHIAHPHQPIDILDSVEEEVHRHRARQARLQRVDEAEGAAELVRAVAGFGDAHAHDDLSGP